jgi:hypothetical protein
MDKGKILGVFIERPFLAIAPAVLFAALYSRRRKSLVLAAALAWLAYFPYEQAMKLRVLCSGECNIRIDLLLLYPLLTLFSIIAVVVYVKARHAGDIPRLR